MTSIAPYVMLAHLAFSFSTYYWINWIFWVHHGLIYATLITAQKAAGKPIFTFSPMGIGIEKRYLGIQESSKTP
jgi:O-antigen ligase